MEVVQVRLTKQSCDYLESQVKKGYAKDRSEYIRFLIANDMR